MNIPQEVLRNRNSKSEQVLGAQMGRRKFLNWTVKGLAAALIPSLTFSTQVSKAFADGGGACPADAIFYWANDTYEAWGRPVEEDFINGEHFNFILHRISDPDTNFLFNYHVSYGGVQTLSDGNDYHVFMSADTVSQEYLPDITLPVQDYSDNASIASDALSWFAYDVANYSRPAESGGISLDDLAITMINDAEIAGGLFDQMLGLLP